MANYQPQTPSLAGLNLTMTAAAGGGDSFENNGNVLAVINNASGAPITVTFDAPKPDNFGVTDNSHDSIVAIPAGQRWTIGPFPTNRFNDVNNRVQMTYSGVTSLTVGFHYAPQAG